MAVEQKASILLRVDASLKDKLFAQAKRNDRTARAEASRILRESLDNDKHTPLAEARSA
jgi:hypothetical protein